MKHIFNLCHADSKTSGIRLIVSHNGKKYRVSTGLVIKTALWDQKAKSLRAKCKDAAIFPKLATIDSRLVEREYIVESEKDVQKAIAYGLTGSDYVQRYDVRLWDYFKEWSERDTPTLRFRQLAYKRIADMMGTSDNWNDIDGDWHFRFVSKMDSLGYSHNYKSTLSAKFRTMMKEAFERGIHTNGSYRLFKAGYKPADTIALTMAEVDAIWNTELYGKEADARDCFIVGVYCAGRFQDYSLLSEENLVDGKLRYVQRKTGETVIIPCSPRILEVFARHGGRAPKITQQETARYMKKVCRNIGGSFNDIVEVKKSAGKKTVIEKHPRWALVSCHTARRSGASILHLMGVPLYQLMLVTGHKTLENIQKYLRLDKASNADMLSGVAFFN